MRVLTRGSRRKPATDERTGSVEATLPSGYSCHHEGQALADGAAAPGSSLPPARPYGGEPQQLTESRRRLYPSRCGYLLGAAGESLPQTKERAALRLPSRKGKIML